MARKKEETGLAATGHIRDVMALVPTPLTESGDIDERGLRNIIEYEMANGCHGVGVLAVIGEGYLLSAEQRQQVIRIAADQLKDKGPLIVGIAAMATQEAVRLAREAEGLGAAAVLAFNPQGIRTYSSAELLAHYRELAGAVGIEVVPYSRKIDLVPLDVLSRLVEERLAANLKYAWQDCELLKAMAATFRDKLQIFCGADEFTLRYLLLGCQGILTATAGILPRDHIDLLEMVRQNRIDEARSLYEKRIMPWNDMAFYANWQAVHKAAFKRMGLIRSDRVVIPQQQAAPYQVEEVDWFVRNHL